MELPTKFEIKGLFGDRDVILRIDGKALILVGQNGIGKSSVANIFYFFITRQWQRLSDYKFSEIAIWFGEQQIRASRHDIGNLSSFGRLLDPNRLSSRVAEYIEKLQNNNKLDNFLSARTLNPRQREEYSLILGIPATEIRNFHSYIRRRLADADNDLFSTPQVNVEKFLAAFGPDRSIFLPTYRRIEKDLQDIFPDMENRLKRSLLSEGESLPTRSEAHYMDLVSFGMEDVRKNISKKTRSIRDYSLKQFNDLSGIYLRDVIRGRAGSYSQSKIASIDEAGLSTILSRVSEQVLSDRDKELLRSKILNIKGKNKRNLEESDKYLAHYFSRLMTVSDDITKQEKDITNFIEVCNAYLKPGKTINYDDMSFDVSISGDGIDDIDLSLLSSGEKQVISLFSHLYLDETKSQIVIIDEPELSLSVPWQKRFLPDILESGHCSFIFAVTHSPFIYQNELRDSAVDLRRMTVRS